MDIPSNVLVSVIVPVYNVREYIDTCVESLVSQTHTNLEIVIVDDGSTDGSSGACDSWMERDPRIRVLHKHNGGLSSARNAGMKLAKGDYIIFVDSDDFVSKELVEKSLMSALCEDADICLFKHAIFDEAKSIERDYKESHSFPSNGASDSEGALLHLFHQHVHNYAVLRIVKAGLYRETNFSFPVGMLMEDLATTASLLSHAERISYLNEPLYFYRSRGGSIFSSWNENLAIDFMSALRMMEDAVLDLDSVWCDAENYVIKMLFYCWMMTARGHVEIEASTRDRIKKSIEDEIAKRLHRLRSSQITWANKLKWFALKFGLLKEADLVRLVIDRVVSGRIG